MTDECNRHAKYRDPKDDEFWQPWYHHIDNRFIVVSTIYGDEHSWFLDYVWEDPSNPGEVLAVECVAVGDNPTLPTDEQWNKALDILRSGRYPERD